MDKPGHGLRWYWAVAVTGMAVFTLGVWWLIYLQLHGLEKDLTGRQVRSAAEAVMGRLSEITRIRKQLLSALANDPALVDYFKEHGTKRRCSKERRS